MCSNVTTHMCVCVCIGQAGERAVFANSQLGSCSIGCRVFAINFSDRFTH